MTPEPNFADGTVLARVDVGNEALVLACVNKQCPMVISSVFPEWKTHVLCLERLFVLGRPENETWILAGSSEGGAPMETNRIQILDDEFRVLADEAASCHGWLIPMPSDLNWGSFYVRYLDGNDELLVDGPDQHLRPDFDEGRDGKYPDRSDGPSFYAPLEVTEGEDPPVWPRNLSSQMRRLVFGV